MILLLANNQLSSDSLMAGKELAKAGSWEEVTQPAVGGSSTSLGGSRVPDGRGNYG